MDPIKLIIPGQYFDSQIYSGLLYLWSLDGRITTVDWQSLIIKIAKQFPEKLLIAFRFGFLDGRYLYNKALSIPFQDNEIKNVILNKFQNLSILSPIEVDTKLLKSCTISEQTNPFPFPHSDISIYLNKIYVASSDGIFSAGIRGKTKSSVSSRAKRIDDIPSYSISIAYNSIAIAGGSEGLYEKKISQGFYSRFDENESDLSQITSNHTSSCRWTYHSIYGTSNLGAGFLADYDKFTIYREIEEKPYTKRRLNSIITDKEIFGENSKISWGFQEKIYQIREQELTAKIYTPWNLEKISKSKSIPLSMTNAIPISFDTSHFGVILEYENFIDLFLSDNSFFRINGEVINWKIFPKSKFYENHFHLVQNNYLEIYSFNHDYFVNQDLKTAGAKYYYR